MPNSRGKQPKSERRLILAVPVDAAEQARLDAVLAPRFQTVFVQTEQEALALMAKKSAALVLLHLQGGTEDSRRAAAFLEQTGERSVPTVIVTSDRALELECLRLGAVDCVSDACEQSELFLERIRRALELADRRFLMQSREFDELTGLCKKDYFYSLCEQFDKAHPEIETDAVMLDVNHFYLINELYGKSFGNDLLRRIARMLHELLDDTDALLGRRDADIFQIYCRHGNTYRKILNAIPRVMTEFSNARVRLRMGVYPKVDKRIEIEGRFDRAKLACDTIRHNFTQNCAVYDKSLQEREMYSERLVEEMEHAMREKQFCVYYQPKYDIRGEQPKMVSAEALVRWKHPTLGLISPGEFIPVFEQNGLIQKLDRYVWGEVAADIRRWREQYGVTMPVSANVSRVDMYDPNLAQEFQQLITQNGISSKDYTLEITESAYTDNPGQLVSVVNDLRSRGFRVEMDDFGSGYSSLNMLTTLPVDALKLDMQFIQNVQKDERNVRMLELVIDIARYLSVPVIAEGVETEEQLQLLKRMGCDMVQGFYFSRPLPVEEFEQMLCTV